MSYIFHLKICFRCATDGYNTPSLSLFKLYVSDFYTISSRAAIYLYNWSIAKSEKPFLLFKYQCQASPKPKLGEEDNTNLWYKILSFIINYLFLLFLYFFQFEYPCHSNCELIVIHLFVLQKEVIVYFTPDKKAQYILFNFLPPSSPLSIH